MLKVDEWSRTQLLLEKARETGVPLSEIRLIDTVGYGDVLSDRLVPILNQALRVTLTGSKPEVVRADLPLTIEQAAFVMRANADEVAALIEMNLLPSDEVEGVTFIAAGQASMARDEVIFDFTSSCEADSAKSSSPVRWTTDQGESALRRRGSHADTWHETRTLLKKVQASGEQRSSIRLIGPDGVSHVIRDRLVSVVRSAARELLLGNQHTVVGSDLRLALPQVALSLQCSEQVVEKLIERKRLYCEDSDGLRVVALGDAISCGAGPLENSILRRPEGLRRC